MIDLNSKEFGGVKIFNNGVAGFTKNVDLTIAKKSSTDPDTWPDYNIVVNDGNGEIRQGFYYRQKDFANLSKEDKDKSQSRTVSRMMDIANEMVPEGFEFPKVSSYEEAIDTIAKIIKEHSAGKKFHVFTTYGSVNYPKPYLELRFFNCVVNAESGRVLKATPNDQMERITPDAPSDDTSSQDSSLDGLSEDGWL